MEHFTREKHLCKDSGLKGGVEGVCSKGAHFAVHVQFEVRIAAVVLTKNGPRRL